MRADLESAKKTDDLNVFFVLLGSEPIKAAPSKHAGEINPRSGSGSDKNLATDP